MSSWYFKSAPRVSAITCGESATASSATRHFAQSIVSATPGFLNRSSVRRRWTKATTSRESVALASGARARRMASSRSMSG
jgi:hypothetical protein